MEYQDVIYFAETWGLIILAVMFMASVLYAFWPANHEQFKRAASVPLENDDFVAKESDHD